MAGDVVLDTSVIVAHFRRDSAVSERMRAAGVLYVPVVAVGELYFGAYLASDSQTAVDRLEDFLSITTILFPDEDTAKWYGRTKRSLEQAGTRIPDDNIWIAATAMQHKQKLAHRDAHFEAIKGLAGQKW